jgi:hypothetical protein
MLRTIRSIHFLSLAGKSSANLGDSGHCWLIAQGPIAGNTANLTIFVSRGGVFDATEPTPSIDPAGDGSITLEFADCTAGLLSYEITSLGLSGVIPIQRVTNSNVALCESLVAQEPNTCVRPEPNISHGVDDPVIRDGIIVSKRRDIVGGGPQVTRIPDRLQVVETT